MGDPICDVIVAMMRYSEIPRDFSSDSLRFAEFGEEEIYRNIRDDSPPSDTSTHSGPLISQRDRDTKSNGTPYTRCYDIKDSKSSKKNLTTSASSPSSGNGYCNYGLGVALPPNNKSKSLPPNASILDLDSNIISALRVSPDELAGQITLLDFPVFSAIQPDELTSCAWTKKNKHIITPNIVGFTRRFNHTIFWTVQEILGGSTPKHRAEILGHFVKVAKKLFDYNNLHSLFAIISALQSASIYRLTKTWSYLSKKEKQTFDRLADIFNDRNNWSTLRKYLDSLKLPCIPYLGLFLTDLVYIDLAHPHTGGLESEQRRTQMNNILRVISSYQGSDYSHVMPIMKTQKYLQSIRYIDELQNIFEDDQYKKSLKLEPPSTSVTNSTSSSAHSSKDTTTTPTSSSSIHLDPSSFASLNLSPAKSGSMRLSSTSTASKFIPGHRKCRSLGSKFRSTSLPRNFHQKCHCATASAGFTATLNRNKMCCIFNKINCDLNSTTDGNTTLQHSRHLLDDSVIEDKPSSDATSTGSSDGGVIGLDTDGDLPNDIMGIQGCIRRKTLLKDGKKPAVASWQRYWLQIWSNSLVYFPPKSFKGNERTDFKREPCKVLSIEGWTAEPMENPQQTNTFQLINTSLGTVYKIRTSSPKSTSLWMEALQRIFNKINCDLNSTTDGNTTLQHSRHLLDDSVIEDKPSSDATSTGSSDGGVIGLDTDGDLPNDIMGIQGCIRRKTLLKDGKKPAVASWQRYWLQIWSNSLVYFPPKSFKGNERTDFKREPCKVLSIEGWTAEPMENPQQTNTFQLINTSLGTVYKIRTSSPKSTSLWMEALQRYAQMHTEKPVPTNLMSFE